MLKIVCEATWSSYIFLYVGLKSLIWLTFQRSVRFEILPLVHSTARQVLQFQHSQRIRFKTIFVAAHGWKTSLFRGELCLLE